MTERAKKLSQAIEEVSWDWENMEPSHPRTIAVATIREVADRLCTDLGELECPIDKLRQIADEVEAL
jgi:hypothetical protein